MKLEAPIECPNCKKTLKVKFDQMRPGKPMKCSCGGVVNFSGDDMSKAQKSFDKLNKTLDNIFK